MAPSRGMQILYSTGLDLTTYSCCRTRSFVTSVTRLSGHNRWSKIKHDKGKNDAAKNRQRSIFSQEIATASRMFGPDPNMNPRLADLITKAKKEGFAKASIESAIARGQGKSASGAILENVTVEGMLPGNVGVIVECETDNRLRTLADVRLAMKEAGGSATPSAYLFQKRGRIAFEKKAGVGMEEVLEPALEAGATDVEEDKKDEQHGGVVVFSEPGDTKIVAEGIANALGLEVATSEIFWSPNEETLVDVPNHDAADQLGKFVDGLHNTEPSISAVAMNVKQGCLSDEGWKDLQSKLTA